jgi:anti-sigma-K factor RskA
VNVSADGRAELKPLKGFEVPAGKAIEIWTLWDRAIGPRSIGLISTTRGAKLDLTKLPRQPGQLFEMTLEPATGSPTGRPTGPILTKGNATVPL